MAGPLEGWWAEPSPDLLAMMSSVAASFEAAELKHQLTRAGFMRAATWHPTPFEPDAFFGDIVLTSGDSPSEFYGPCVEDAACVFFSGVVTRPLFGGLVRPEREGHPDLQVGVVMMERLARPVPIPGSWTMTRAPRGASGMITLASRARLQRLLEDSRQDRTLLLENRDRFFESRWRELSSSGLAERWQRT